MSRLPQPGERARILSSEIVDRIGATGRYGVVMKTAGFCIPVRLDDARALSGPADGHTVVWCTISEVELMEEERSG